MNSERSAKCHGRRRHDSVLDVHQGEKAHAVPRDMAMNTDPVIGQVQLMDGVMRDVYQQRDGDPYLLDEDGAPVIITWLLLSNELLPADVPVVVERESDHS